jgi:hypothetical protein
MRPNPKTKVVTEPKPKMDLTEAERVCWVLDLPQRPPYSGLRDEEQDVREAWLNVVAGRDLTHVANGHEVYEKFLRKAVKVLTLGAHPYTVTRDGQVTTVWLYRKTWTLSAKRTPKLDDRPGHLADLMLAASQHVARCLACRTWFPRKTLKQRHCRTQCANAERARRARGRRGARRRVKRVTVAPGEAREALTWPTGLSDEVAP